MKYILSILGSSVFGVLVTLVFNWMQNRRTASLSYITDERKNWREKIRTISAQIEKCGFRGEGEQRIEQYLVQLQMNINPYGSLYKEKDNYYYKQDAYIWDAVNGIRNAPNKKLFDKNKELLLRYLSIMLKLDWERSKKEVKNFSVMKILWVLTVVFCAATFLYENFILNLRSSEESILYFLTDALIICVIFLASGWSYELYTSGDKDEGTISLRKSLVKEEKGKIVSLGCLYIAACVAVVSAFWASFAIPGLMVQNMKYYTGTNGQVYLYPNFNEDFFPDFQVKLKKELGKEVNILENAESEVKIAGLNVDYTHEIKGVLAGTQMLVFAAIFIRNFLVIISCILLCQIDDIDSQAKMNLERTKYLILGDYEKTIQDVLLVIESVAEMYRNHNSRKEIDELLGLSYNALHRVKEKLLHQVYMEKMQIESMQQWKIKNQKQWCLDLVKDSIKLLKKYSRRKWRSARLKILIQLRDNLQDIIDTFP